MASFRAVAAWRCLRFLSASVADTIHTKQTTFLHKLKVGNYCSSAPVQPSHSQLEVETSAEDFKYVERLLPSPTVPDPPVHPSYPTPSGWVPPKESAKNLPYYVRRTKNHMLPVYLEERNGGSRKLILIKRVEGDIWGLEKDLREYLQRITGRERIATQVNEVTQHVRVKGLYQREVADFLLEKGF